MVFMHFSYKNKIKFKLQALLAITFLLNKLKTVNNEKQEFDVS